MWIALDDGNTSLPAGGDALVGDIGRWNDFHEAVPYEITGSSLSSGHKNNKPSNKRAPMIDIFKLARDGGFLSFDIEGDGNSGQRPVELSFCQFNENGFVAEHYFLIDPERPMSVYAIRKHGLTDAVVQGRDTIRDVSERIRQLVANQILVGHSAINDVHLISSGIPDFLLLPKAILDTQRVARRLSKLRKQTIPESLSGFAAINDIDPHDAPPSLARSGVHSASTDAWLTGQVFRAAIPLLPDDYASRRQYPEMLSIKVSDARRREIEDRLMEQDAGMKP